MIPRTSTDLARGGIALLTALFFASLCVGLSAQTPPPDSAGPKPKKRAVQLKSDLTVIKENPGGRGRTYILTGNVMIRSEDTTLRTDAATYNMETGIASSPGKVQIDDAQNTLVGDKGVAYYRKRTANVTGNVRITMRPRPQDQSAPEGSLRREFKDPAFITCDAVDYNWRTRVAATRGELTMRQRNRTVTAERAVYDGRNEKVSLTGDVHGVTTDGDDIRARKATAILTEGKEELILEAPQGVIRVDIEEDEEGAETPTPAAPATPAIPAPAPATPPETAPALPGAGPRP